MHIRLCTLWSICILGDFVTCKSCYDFNPLVLNTTVQSPDVLKCPKNCKCQYCRLNITPGGSVITYQHEVDCSSRGFARVPADDIPVDAMVIRLNSNKITKLDADTFKRTPNVRYIDLSANGLLHTNINDNAFRGLCKLNRLSLSNNRGISNVRRVWFEPLTALGNIRIAKSGVLSIEEDAFQGFQNLSVVVLNNNGITKLPPKLFHGLPKLQRIFLQHNSIPCLPPNMFLGSRNILEVNVAYNQITEISRDVHLQNLTKLMKLSVEKNPYVCDCAILWLREWLLNGTSSTVLDKDEITCASGPTEVINKGVMTFDEDILDCQPQLIMIITVTCSVAAVVFVVASLIYYHRWNIRYLHQRRRLRKQYERLTHSPAPPLDQSTKYDAFISYNSKDQEWITGVLQPTLEAPPHNLTLCVDYRDFLVGEAIAQNIANSIRSSRKTVLVISKNFVHSEWCNFELEMAHNRMFDSHEDILVTILLEDVKVSSMPVLLQRVLRKRTYIEWPNEEGRKVFWMRLARAIGSPNFPLETSRIGINRI